jgi:hypothetical protein
MVKVKNINGTSANITTCNCGSWINHWDKFSPSPRSMFCVVKGCLEEVLEGAHVKKIDTGDDNWYIVPFCHRHNLAKDEELEIPTYHYLVPADINETCDKE